MKIVINLKSDPYIENLPKFLPLTLVYPSDLEIDPCSFQLSASYEEIISSNDGIDNLTSTVSNYHIFNVILLAFFCRNHFKCHALCFSCFVTKNFQFD